MNTNLNQDQLFENLYTIYEDNTKQIEELQRVNRRISNLLINTITVPPMVGRPGSAASSIYRGLSQNRNANISPNTNINPTRNANINLWTSNASVNTFLNNLPGYEGEDSNLTEEEIGNQVTFSPATEAHADMLCPIDMSSLSDNDVATINYCQHKFSAPALRRWLQANNTCPVCRFNMKEDHTPNPNQAHIFSNDESHHRA